MMTIWQDSRAGCLSRHHRHRQTLGPLVVMLTWTTPAIETWVWGQCSKAGLLTKEFTSRRPARILRRHRAPWSTDRRNTLNQQSLENILLLVAFLLKEFRKIGMRIKWRQHAVNLVWNHCMFTWFRKREQVCCFLFRLRFCYFIQLSLSIDFQCLTIITFGNTHVKEAINTLSDNIVWEDRYLVAKESSVRPTPCMNNCEKARLRIELKKTEMWCGAGKIREPSISNIWYYGFIGGVEVYGREIARGLSYLQIIEEDRTSVVALFFGTWKCVPVHLFLPFLAHKFLRWGQ